MTASNAADVVNLVGFATGTALYAMLLALVLRGGSRAPEDADRVDWLPLSTALLGLAWNLGELAAYALPRLGIVDDTAGVSAMSFPALGMLAAVVVHSVARGLRYGPVVIVLAYGLAATAAVLHVGTILSGDPAPSTLAFQLLTVSFSLLIVPLGFITRSQPNGRRALWVLALVLFAVSATHLGSFHTIDDSWWMQLLGHHAAIPLAFAILYQNYRFALGDLFLKQALTLLAIVALTLAGYSAVLALPAGPTSVGVLLGLWVMTAMITPWLRRLVVRFVDAVLLGRVDYAVLRQDIAPGGRRSAVDRRGDGHGVRAPRDGVQRTAGVVGRGERRPLLRRRLHRAPRWCPPPSRRSCTSTSASSPAGGGCCPTMRSCSRRWR